MATVKQQAKSTKFSYKGRELDFSQLIELGKQNSIKEDTLLSRIYTMGWSVEKAIDTPKGTRTNSNAMSLEKKQIYAQAKAMGMSSSTISARYNNPGFPRELLLDPRATKTILDELRYGNEVKPISITPTLNIPSYTQIDRNILNVIKDKGLDLNSVLKQALGIKDKYSIMLNDDTSSYSLIEGEHEASLFTGTKEEIQEATTALLNTKEKQVDQLFAILDLLKK